jgi:MarR family transcriptional regulator, organic hydroperoxide resistance regulator
VRQAELLRYLVLAAQREGNRRLSRDLAPLGLTPSQAEVLRVLGDREPLTLTALGELLICESGTNPSRLVDRLVSAGFVHRAVSTDDRRQLVLTLTATGREAEAAVRQIEERLYGEIDAATAGVDLTVSLHLLGAMVKGQPAGDALQRRR